MSNPQIVRLSTGEELLCSCDPTPTHVNVTKPYLILPTAEGSIQFMKYMAYADYDKLPIKVDNIMWIVNASVELSDKYREMTGAIATPLNKIIT